MRMSPHKIKDLAGQIVAMMADHEGIHLNQDETALKVVVGGVILDDLEEEDDIDREVDELIQQHASEIAQDDIDVDVLRRKFRSEIARRRGVVLGGGALRLSEERIEVISIGISDRLAEEELVDLTIDEEDLADLIGEAIITDLKFENEVHREAVEWLEINGKHLDPGSSAWQIELEQRREQIAIKRGYQQP